MKKETIRYATGLEVEQFWTPTAKLRWFVTNIYNPINYEFNKVLQQMWTSNLGNKEWRDIPIENNL